MKKTNHKKIILSFYPFKNKKTTWNSLTQRLSFDLSSEYEHLKITWLPFTFVNSTVKPQSGQESNDYLGWRPLVFGNAAHALFGKRIFIFYLK
jgi:hypothetical protein